MSNSSLAKKWLPVTNYDSGRGGYKITKITPHHMAGDLSLETCQRVLQNAGSSVQYGIDSNGTIGQFVDESNRTYASCSSWNDNQAVTIEVANCQIGDDWRVSDAAYKSLVNLCVDICQRNGIKSLSWTGGTDGSLTAHYLFWPTQCPGPYLKSKMSSLAAEVNKILAGGKSAPVPVPTTTPAPTPKPVSKQRTIADVYNARASYTASQACKTGQAASNIILGTNIAEDGEFGYQTAVNAVKMIQWACNKDYEVNLDIDGIWGVKTSAAFGSHYVEYGETQYLVTTLEVLLLMNGYNPHGIEIPGGFGEGCKTATGQYQRDSGLDVDYVAGRDTFYHLTLV